MVDHLSLTTVNELEVPRYLFPERDKIVHSNLHTFAGAS